jgi:lantibiotic biosynthesis protein
MFHSKLIVRTPTLPFDENLSEDFLREMLENQLFAEALYLASPTLYEEAMNWKAGTITDPKKAVKVPQSLGKYYSRMCSRCTPFGLFAGCGVAEWAEETSLILDDDFERKTRLDKHYTGALAQQLAEIASIRHLLLYYPNSSIYRIGEDIRYVEYKYVEGKRQHQISAITWSEYIQLVLDLCKKGTLIKDIIPHLVDDEISDEEATNFVEQLIENQLLVNELEPSITGKGLINQIKKTLISHENISEVLGSIETGLGKIDSRKINNISAYQDVMSTLERFGTPYEVGKIFQTDSVRLFQKNTLNKTVQEELKTICDLLIYTSEISENQRLKDFQKSFFQRYETQEQPLLFVLDTETGIGYGDSGKSHNTPIAEGLQIPNLVNESTNLTFSKIENFLYAKWLESLKSNAFEVSIEVKDLQPFCTEDVQIPPSCSVMFRLTGDGRLPIFLEGISGSSAVNLLGRFAHADEAVHEIVQDIVELEESKNPAVVFAEIVHLPENRIGNILLHPPFRKYEIPYLAKSSLPIEYQVTLDDLYVSVDSYQNRIILRSKRLNKEVIPRLSNAHNYSANSLPLYHFLCDLQTQNVSRNFDLGWSKITTASKFSPRLTLQNIVLNLATWRFTKHDYTELISSKSDSLLAKMKAFCEKWQIPQLFVLADFDNELLVNTENLLSVEIWIEAIKRRDKITIKEFLYNPEGSPVKNKQGQGFTNQFIATWINNHTVYPALNLVSDSDVAIQRNFSIGSEWIYVKLYSGAKIADTILTSAIKPLVGNLLAQQLIDKWFFIRYSDPEKHLRLRFHLTDLNDFGEVFKNIKNAIEPFENEGLIWKVQADTYQREVERYGADTMEFSESIFCEDSNLVMEMLDQTWGDEREPIRWQWTLKVINTYLDDFGLSLLQKKELLERMKTSFALEYKMDKALKMQIDQRFRNNRAVIEQILDESLNATHPLAPLFISIQRKSEMIKSVVANIKKLKSESQLSKYLSDTIHMTVNRSISDNQRLHELVMYDFLYRYYQAELAKQKNK